MKTIIKILGKMIIIAMLVATMISAAIAADMTFGFTAPTEAEFTGITLTADDIHMNYRTYKDRTKTLGFAIYDTYCTPVLEEIGLI